jgi:imidazolonepropionase-like amidohydrolase
MNTVIHNIRVLDGRADAAIESGWIAVEGEHISEVGRGSPGAIGSDTLAIDGHGRTAVPGLIDSHAHVAGLHRLERPGDLSPDGVAADTIDVLHGLDMIVRGGLTTIRDCGYPHHGVFAIRERADQGAFASPRLLLSGRAICATEGHGAFLSVQVTGVDETRRAVRIEAKAGADWIKLMLTGGTATPGEAVSDVQLTIDEARAAVEEAHRRGRRVCAHCSNLAGTNLALDAGVDSIEHGIAIDDAAARRMADQGVWLASTLLCTQTEGLAGPDSGIPEHVRRKGAEIFRQQQESFQRALASGVRIAAATDAEVPYLSLGAETLASELALMVDLGMSPAHALRAATGEAAELLGLGTETGTFERGRTADLLLLSADPLENIRSVGAPELVMRAGRVIFRDNDKGDGHLDRY